MKQDIKGFKVLPVKINLSPLITHQAKEVYHYIYIKQHEKKGQDESDTKTVFAINLPTSIDNIKALRNLFRQISDGSLIESCDIANSHWETRKNDVDLAKLTSEYYNPDGEKTKSVPHLPFNTALIKFVDVSAMKLFLNNVKKIAKNGSGLPVLEQQQGGIARMISSMHSKVFDPQALKERINVSLEDFNRKEAEEEEQVQNSGKIVDSDGFQLVVTKHRKTKAAILGKTDRLKLVNNQELSSNMAKNENKKQRKDFYRFQIRERKKQEINQLLLKFREDQARIKVLKERKRFRPY